MPRRRVLVIALAVIVFLAISLELARYLSAPSAERNHVYDVLKDAARGDAGRVIARLQGCREDPVCVAQTTATVAKVKADGDVKILSYESPTAYALGTKTAKARVAWAMVDKDGLPVVQCVTVQRKWSFTSGGSVSLRRLSAPIGNEAGC